MKKLIFTLPLFAALVACSNGDMEVNELETHSDLPSIGVDDSDKDNSSSAVDEGEELGLRDANLEKAFQSFLSQGVPEIPLSQAFEFYRNNRASVGGLQDTSCLIKPMSETGEIGKKDNRYDPTTIAMLKEGIRNERYIMIVDYTQPNTNKRGYLLDMKADANGKYTVTKMTVAHGYGSQAVDGVPTTFTNASGHGTTVSGFFLSASKTYPFYSNASSGSYTSTGMRLYGLESTNNTAEKSSKVAHGAPYVTDSRAGNSAGCPAMKHSYATENMKNFIGGMLWYHYTKINKSASYKDPGCVKPKTLANN